MIIEEKLVEMLKEIGVVERHNIFPLEVPSNNAEDAFSYRTIAHRSVGRVRDDEYELIETLFAVSRHSKTFIRLCNDAMIYGSINKYSDLDTGVMSARCEFDSDYRDQASGWYEREYRVTVLWSRKYQTT